MNTLHEELLALFDRGVDAPLPEPEFDRLALAVFRYQFERNAPYAAFCRARGLTPDRVDTWLQIPAVATSAFKAAELTTVRPDDVRVTYFTSGTTRGTAGRGRHLLPGTELYDAALAPNFKAHLLPEFDSIRVCVLGPTAEFFPHSSLGHMHSRVLEAWGAPGSGTFWTDTGPRLPELMDALQEAAAGGTPVCLLGTALGFGLLLDAAGDAGFRVELPPGSRIMDTGGYKGQSREIPKPELYAAYGSLLGVPLTHVVNEYGMTELGSQYYDSALREFLDTGATERAAARARVKIPPPWTRVRVVDPETLAPLPEGQIGLIRHLDLANLYSVAAVQTDDLGAQRGRGFEVLGRAAGAEPRGCSLTAEAFVRER